MSRPTKIFYAIGDQRHDLTIIGIIGHKPEGSGHKKFYYAVKCVCGTEFEIVKNNFGRQIGCLKCGNVRTGRSKLTHGATRKSGSIRAPLYKIWRSMLGRCKPGDKRAHWYADKGIRVCDDWLKDFAAFRTWAVSAGWIDGKDLSIDRIDSDKNYEPGNCRWVTRSWNTRRLTSISRNGVDPILAAAQEWLAARKAVQEAGKPCHRFVRSRLLTAEMKLEAVIPAT